METAIRRKLGLGASPLRTEDERLLTGRARYVENRVGAEHLHAAFLRSPYAHARIARIDLSRATEVDGVIAIFTGGDLIGAGVGPLPFHPVVRREDGEPMQPPARLALAHEIARFSGEAVAFVVARSRRIAMEAVELIDVSFAELKAVTSARSAFAEDAPLLAPGAPRNVAGLMNIGDKISTREAFENASHVVKLRLRNQRLAASPMETRSSLAEYDELTGQLILRTGNQAPHMARAHLASALGIQESQLRIIVEDIGGGFGMKLTAYPEELALLHAANVLKQSIHWKADRSEAFLSDTHGRDHDTDAEMALDATGKILGVRLRVFANMGAYLSYFGITVATGSGNRVVSSLYDIPTMDVEIRAMLTNTAPIGPYRGAGRPEAIYRIERLLDVAALELGMDSAEIRRRNLVQPNQIPYRAYSGQVYESGNFPRVLERALALADWERFSQRKAEAESRGLLYGKGICCHVDTTSGIRNFEEVRIEAAPSARFVVFSGTQAMGQGLATVYASLLAGRLGVDIDAVEIIQGDTNRVADGVGSYGSRSLFIGGAAVLAAADDLIATLRGRAAEMLTSNSGDVGFECGEFIVGGRRLSLSALLSQTGPAEGRGRHESPFVFPNGCYICEVELEPDTGLVRIARFCGVDDVGVVAHPKIVHGQVIGSIVQGIGQALYEQVSYDGAGQLLSASLMDYALPRAGDVPPFNVEADETSPSTTNPLGAKGAGEAGCLGAPPAIVGAVVDALSGLGVRHIDMPLTPAKVWRAIQNTRASLAA